MELRKVNPAMPVAPTVIYGDEILVESGAIIDIILNRHAPGKLIPPVQSKDYAWHTIWMHYAEGSLAARALADYRVWQIQPPTQKGPLVDAGGVMRYAEDFLGKHPYFGGAEFSAADIMMQFPLEYAFRINIVDKSKFPNINAWNAKVTSRPAYQRMNAKAEPNGFLGPPAPLPDNARAPG
jgi:glutathione S-transferase